MGRLPAIQCLEVIAPVWCAPPSAALRRPVDVAHPLKLFQPLQDGGLALGPPRQASELKLREEIEITIDNPDAARELLGALGFIEVLRFGKRRESWQFNDCQIELDQLPHLGCYVEIEGPNEAQVREVTKVLDMNDKQHIPSSYIALLVKYCQDHGLQSSHITFDQT